MGEAVTLLDTHGEESNGHGLVRQALAEFGLDESFGAFDSMTWNLALSTLRRAWPTRAEIAGLTVCALAFTFWNAAATQTLAPDVPLFFSVLCLASVLVGRVAVRVAGVDASHDFPTVFLFGFLLLNSALLVLAWTSPFSIVTNAFLLLACAVALQAVEPTTPDPGRGTRLASPGLLAVILILAAATLWSQDSITARIVLPDGVLLKPWVDSLFHAQQIQAFRAASGPVSVGDPRMAGQPMWFYHHGSYIATALLSRATGTPTFLAHTSFQVPFGLVLTGLAAYALIRSLWGDGAGLAAAAALLLLPDASWHGLANPGLSYQWLQQAAPAGLYGVAVLAVAWLLMFEGCRTGRLSLVALAFLTTGLTIHYKAQFFVAAALLIWIYPGLCLSGFRWRWKLAWLGFALTSFVMAVRLSGSFESIPVLRLDGSALKEYMSANVAWLTHGPTRSFFSSRLTPTSSFSHDLFWGAVLLFYGTFGLFGVASIVFLLVVLVRQAFRRPTPARLGNVVFPLLIIVNYLVMALGLAFNNKPPAHHDELLHRPLVWAYFVVAAWAGGLAYVLFLEDRVRRSRPFRNALMAGLVLLLIVPFTLGQNVQVGPEWGRAFTNQAYPRGWYECALYIREHAGPGEVVQDAEGDPKMMMAGISEHPAYAIDYFDLHRPRVLVERLEELQVFKAMNDAGAIRRFAALRQIRWYVTHPTTRLRWPSSILNHPEFCWNGYCVYSFSR